VFCGVSGIVKYCSCFVCPAHSPFVAGTQFERTLIVAEDDAEVSYLEGCTAPSYDKNQVWRSVLLEL